jgi:anti-anti-sigma regulatory factor
VGVTLEQNEGLQVIRLEESVDISSAGELKRMLLEAFEAGGPVEVSLEKATYLDVTAMQLLWAAGREAKTAGVGFGLSGAAPEAIAASLADAGFEQFPVGVVEK